MMESISLSIKRLDVRLIIALQDIGIFCFKKSNKDPNSIWFKMGEKIYLITNKGCKKYQR